MKAEVQDPLEEVTLGTPETLKPAYVSKFLPEDVKQEFIKLLFEFKVCFAWHCDKMPGLSRDLVENELPIKARFMPNTPIHSYFILPRIKEGKSAKFNMASPIVEKALQ